MRHFVEELSVRLVRDHAMKMIVYFQTNYYIESLIHCC